MSGMYQTKDGAKSYTQKEIAAMEAALIYENPHAAAALAWAAVAADHLARICDALRDGLYNHQVMLYLDDAVEQLATACDWLPECNAKGERK